MVLTGVKEKRIDSKGRLSIPKKLRSVLSVEVESEFMVLKLDGCLQAYPLRYWSYLQDRIERLSPFQDRTRRLQRLWGMNADRMSLDGEGRITLREDQKDYAGITQDVVLIGAINKVEIWAPVRWRKMVDDAPRLEEIANDIDSQG